MDPGHLSMVSGIPPEVQVERNLKETSERFMISGIRLQLQQMKSREIDTLKRLLIFTREISG